MKRGHVNKYCYGIPQSPNDTSCHPVLYGRHVAEQLRVICMFLALILEIILIMHLNKNAVCTSPVTLC